MGKFYYKFNSDMEVSLIGKMDNKNGRISKIRRVLMITFLEIESGVIEALILL